MNCRLRSTSFPWDSVEGVLLLTAPVLRPLSVLFLGASTIDVSVFVRLYWFGSFLSTGVLAITTPNFEELVRKERGHTVGRFLAGYWSAAG